MDLGLEGKTVLVTGGARGIGEAVVRTLIAEGAVPVIIDRDEAEVTRLEEELTRDGRRFGTVVVDLEEPEASRVAVEQGARVAGRIDALVNNAGVNDGIGLEDGSPATFLRSLRRNLVHYFEMTHYSLPFLKTTRGAVVNVASKVAVTGQGGTSGYAAAKGGILALTREWAVDLLPWGIRVNAVVPAEVGTPQYSAWIQGFPNAEEKFDSIVRKIPLGQRMTTAEEVAAAVVFLLSGRASHITGQHVFVDGGYVHLDRSAP